MRIDEHIDALELGELGFDGVTPAATGRPGYHPSPMLKLYIYGYLNRVHCPKAEANSNGGHIATGQNSQA
jgi:transposase